MAVGDRLKRDQVGGPMLAVATVAVATVAACGGTGLDSDSTCRDFLNAPLNDQNELVAQVAADVGAANAVTPLGRPNVDYLCVQSPDMTVGEAIRRTG